MSRVVFPISGAGFYRTLGPIIEAALEDPEFDVQVLLGPLPSAWNSKSYLTPTRQNIPRRLVERSCRARTVESGEQWVAALAEADVVVSLLGRRAMIRDLVDPISRSAATALLRTHLWCVVLDADHSVLPGKHFEDAEMIFWPSPYWLDWAAREGVGAREDLGARSWHVGYVRADNLRRSLPRVTREEWGIDSGRPVVLYIPDGYRLRQPRANVSDWYVDVWCVDQRLRRLARATRSRRSPRSIWGVVFDGRSHARMVAQVRAFCDRNDAQLVMIRRRPKEWLDGQEFSEDELRAADCIIREQEQYPQTMLRALQVADLAICPYRSGTVLDAIVAGVPYVTVGLPYYADSPANENYNRRFDAEQGHWPGATWVVAADEFIRSFAPCTLDDFAIDRPVLGAIRAKYTGPVDGRCSNRILDAIKDRLAARRVPARGRSQADPG